MRKPRRWFPVSWSLIFGGAALIGYSTYPTGTATPAALGLVVAGLVLMALGVGCDR